MKRFLSFILSLIMLLSLVPAAAFAEAGDAPAQEQTEEAPAEPEPSAEPEPKSPIVVAKPTAAPLSRHPGIFSFSHSLASYCRFALSFASQNAIPIYERLVDYSIAQTTGIVNRMLCLFAPFLLFAQIRTGAVCANCPCIFEAVFPLFV